MTALSNWNFWNLFHLLMKNVMTEIITVFYSPPKDFVNFHKYLTARFFTIHENI